LAQESKRTESGIPTVKAALALVLRDADPAELEVERIDIRLLPTGQVTYRLYARDEESFEGGVGRVA
jgi:hypothetical protein